MAKQPPQKTPFDEVDQSAPISPETSAAKGDQAAQTPPDPFDPARFRLSPNFGANLGVKKLLLTVPIRTPDNAAFVQAHPDQAYRLDTAVIELKEERELYIVSPELRDELCTEPTFRVKAFITAMTRQGVLFLWPYRLPVDDQKFDDWGRSMLEAVSMATKRWIRVVSNKSLNAYDVLEAPASLPDPKWPDIPFSEILRVAFKDRVIDSLDHPVLKKLRGEA